MIWIIQLTSWDGEWFNAWPHEWYETKKSAVPKAKELAAEAMSDGWRVVKFAEVVNS